MIKINNFFISLKNVCLIHIIYKQKEKKKEKIK